MDDPEYGSAEYLCHQVVSAVQGHTGRELTKTEFNKQCYIVHKELQEDEEIDSGLPVYWYEHGIMVDLEEVLDQFLKFEYQRFQSGNSGRVAVIDEEWEPDEFDVEPTVARKIRRKALDVAERYRGVFDTTRVKDDTYEKYGNRFIQNLNEARYYIEELGDVDAVRKEDYITDVGVSYSDIVGEETEATAVDIPENADEIEDDVKDHLDSLVETYPSDKYDKMAPQFRKWESISRQFAMNHMFSRLSAFTNDFWVAFSKGELRIHHHENIPSRKVKAWKNKRRGVINDFEEELEEYRDALLANRGGTNDLSVVSESYSQAVRDTYSDLREP